MREYSTVSSPSAIRGALRALDLLGELPVREPLVDAHGKSLDFAGLRDDWNAVGEDLSDAVGQLTRELEESRPDIQTLLRDLRREFDALLQEVERHQRELELWRKDSALEQREESSSQMSLFNEGLVDR